MAKLYDQVVATQIFFAIFIPKIGEDESNFNDHIFQLGWEKNSN